MTHRFGRHGKKEGRRFGGFSGRPDLLPQDHGAWKNADNGYARYETQSKLTMCEVNGSEVACPTPWGAYGPEWPPNVSGDPQGYNTKLFRSEDDVAKALLFIGYKHTDGNAMIRRFQRHWNGVISHIAHVPDRYKTVNFVVMPQGNVIVDGLIGPQTLNALEIAILNQREVPALSWHNVVELTKNDKSMGYGRRHKYNAAQGA